MLHVQPHDFFDRPDDDTPSSRTPAVHMSQKAKRTILDVGLGLGIMLAALSGGAYLMVKNTTTDDRSKASGEPQSVLAFSVSPSSAMTPGQSFSVDLTLDTTGDKDYTVSGVDAVVSYSFTSFEEPSEKKRCSKDADCREGSTCYQPPMPLCPEGVTCTQVLPEQYCLSKKDEVVNPDPPTSGPCREQTVQCVKEPCEKVIVCDGSQIPEGGGTRDRAKEASLPVFFPAQLLLKEVKTGSIFDEYPTVNKRDISSNQNTVSISGVKTYTIDDQGYFKGFSGKGVVATLLFVAPSVPGTFRINYIYKGATATDDTNINGFSNLLAASVQKPQERLLSSPSSYEGGVGTQPVPSSTPVVVGSISLKCSSKNTTCPKGMYCKMMENAGVNEDGSAPGVCTGVDQANLRMCSTDSDCGSDEYCSSPEGVVVKCEEGRLCPAQPFFPPHCTSRPQQSPSPTPTVQKACQDVVNGLLPVAPLRVHSGGVYANWGGLKERWFIDNDPSNTSWYYIYPKDGRYIVMKWYKGLSALGGDPKNDVVVMTVENPLCYNALTNTFGFPPLEGPPPGERPTPVPSPLPVPTKSPTSTSACGWCGDSCGRVNPLLGCPDRVREPNVVCIEENNACVVKKAPPNCSYQSVQCVKAPCYPVLVCSGEASPTPTSSPKPVVTLRIPVEIGLEGNPAMLPSLTLYAAPVIQAAQEVKTNLPSISFGDTQLQAIGTVPFQRDERGVLHGVFEIVDQGIMKMLTRPSYLYIDTPSHLRTYYGKPISYTMSMTTTLNFGTLATGNVYADPTSSAKDNTINTFDVAEMFTQWGDPKTECVGSDTGACFRKYQSADLNGDGIVNNRDYALLINNFGKQGAQFPPGSAKTPPMDWDIDKRFIQPEPPVPSGGGGEELAPVNRAPVQ